MSSANASRKRGAVVTGPTGVVGIALVSELLSQGLEVFAVCRPGSRRLSNLPSSERLHCVELPLERIADLPDVVGSQWVDRIDWFFHLGWGGTFGAQMRNDVTRQIDNVASSVSAVDAAAALGCSVFVGAGSQAEFGRHDGVLAPETPTNPENGYGIAKLCAGQMTRLRCNQLGIRHEWLRILSVYGPYELEGTLVYSLIDALLRGEEMELTAGTQTWDFVYSKDAARALVEIARSGMPDAVYVLGSGSARPLRDYVEEIRDAIDPTLPLGFGAVPYGEGQVMNLQADITVLQKDTGYSPAWTFAEGVRETIDWHRSRLSVNGDRRIVA